MQGTILGSPILGNPQVLSEASFHPVNRQHMAGMVRHALEQLAGS